MSEPVDLLAFFKAMANESRLKIVGLLSAGERSVQELAQALALTEPTVSHHLAMLKSIGLVAVRAEGTTRWHSLKPDALKEMNRALLDGKNVASLAGFVDADDKVLAAFLDSDGRLKSIPASRRKRWTVLKWLAEKFVEGRKYREREVNETIQHHHWDSATLRRELIGHRMMARKNAVYWRLPEREWKGFDDRGVAEAAR